jgi:hypothetical protein
VGATIEETCDILEGQSPELQRSGLDNLALDMLDPDFDGDQSDRIADDATIEQLIDYLERVLGLQTEEPIEP